MSRPRHFRPRWGQNFLAADDVARWIVQWAGVDGSRVLEIGPGHGALTKPLLEHAAFVRAVEIDPGVIDGLRRECEWAGERLEIVVGDILSMVGRGVVEPGMHVVANLPYESATAIIRMLLTSHPPAAEIVVMIQREVCRRLAAVPGDREYGLLGIHTFLRADVETGRVVPPGCFRPRPKVESQVVRLRPLAGPRYHVGDDVLFGRIVAAGFRMRRKMLRNSVVPFLRSILGADAAVATLADAGIDPHARPENVSVEAFARLSSLVHARGGIDA